MPGVKVRTTLPAAAAADVGLALRAARPKTPSIARSNATVHFTSQANTQAKGGQKEKVGGGGAAGMAARTTLAGARSCVLCKSPFNPRAPKTQLQEHVDSKHSKNGFAACFPDFTE